ncbi:uncharacterized protein METZ01_LOCUS416563, partial [marine metagenome]
MFYYFILGIIFVSLGIANTFVTSLGECTLEIYGGRIEDIPEIVELVKNESIELVEEFGGIEQKPFSIYITSNMNEFHKKSKGPIPEWGIAVAKKNPDKIIIKAPGIANISFSRMKEVIIHELNHIFLYRIPQNNSMPSWFKEGLAMRSSKEFSLLHKIEISKSHWNNQTLPLAQLQNFNNFTRGKINLAYAESAAAVEALEYYYGETILINILNNMRQSISFQKALNNASKEELVDFEINFEAYLKNNYNWIFLFMSPKYVYVI